MIITSNWLKEKGACNSRQEWFDSNYPVGVDALELLAAIPNSKHSNWDKWLIENAGQIEPRLYGPNGERVIAEIERITKIQWLKPKQENRVKVAALVIEHCRHLERFGCPQDVAVKFTGDLDVAWDAAWGAARDAAWDAAWDAARDAARDAAWGAAWDAARDAVWDAAWDAARGAARDAAWDAARDAAYIIVEDKLDWDNPWAPLVEICELGYLPICMTVDGVFLVYEPKIGE